MRHHFIPFMMAMMKKEGRKGRRKEGREGERKKGREEERRKERKKQKNNKCWWGYGDWNPCVLQIGMWNGAGTVEDSMAVPHRVKHGIIIWSSNSTSGYILQRTESRVSSRFLHTQVHSSIIQNSQKAEATQMSISGWMNKQNVVYTCNAVLVGLKKRNSDTYYNMDGPQKHYAVQNDTITEGQILCNFF